MTVSSLMDIFPPLHTRAQMLHQDKWLHHATGINICTGDKNFNHLHDSGHNIPMLFQISDRPQSRTLLQAHDQLQLLISSSTV